MRILLDTNVIVDFLQNREPWVKDAYELFAFVATDRVEGCVTAKELTDIHYLSRKSFPDNGDQHARAVLNDLLNLFVCLDTTAEDCKKALSAKGPDYEDCLMAETALREKVSYIVTRNIQDYKNSPVPAITPAELNQKLSTSH